MTRRLAFPVMMALGVLTAKPVKAQSSESYEQPPISYSTTQPRDRMAQVQARLATSAKGQPISVVQWADGDWKKLGPTP